MKARDKMISRPSSQPRLKRTLFGAFTLLAWSVYLYLWAPLATLVLWFIGLRTTYLQLYLQQNAVNTTLLLHLAGIAALCAASLIGWAEYNRGRFHGADRRARQPDATLAEIAERLGADADEVATLQDSRISTVRIGDRVELLPLHVGLPLDAPTLAPPAAGRPLRAVEHLQQA